MWGGFVRLTSLGRPAKARRARIVLCGLLLAGLTVSPANAFDCDPRPRWYEQSIDELAALNLAEETRWWDEAQTVVLVRRVQRTRLRILGQEARRVRLEPLRVLKGPPIDGAFTLEHVEVNACGASPDWDVLAGWQADEFLVYLNGARARQEAVIGTRGRRQVQDPRARSALQER